MKQKKNLPDKSRPILLSGVFLFLAIFIVSFAGFEVVRAFTGPGTQGPGTGNGAIGTNSANDLSIGTSTTATGTKVLILASSSDTTSYGIQLKAANATPLFYVRADGSIGIATSSFPAGVGLSIGGNLNLSGSIVGLMSASNISSGVFGGAGSGANYSVPGSLGVGTSSQVGLPAVLTVYGNGGALLINSTQASTDAAMGFGILGTNKSLIGAAGSTGGGVTGSVTGDLYFRTVASQNILFSTDAGATSQLYLKAGGNVGIGTTNPSTALDVKGYITLEPPAPGQITELILTNSSGTAGSLSDGTSGGNLFLQANGSLFFQTNGNNNTMMLSSGGNVGIATTSPAYTLDVNGTIRGSTLLGAFSGSVAAGNVTAGNFNSNFGGGGAYGFSGSLQVGGASSGFYPLTINAPTGGGGITWQVASTTLWDTYVGSDNNYYISDNTRNIVIVQRGAPTSSVIVTFGGNVGIGTPNPTRNLTVSSATSSWAYQSFNTGGTEKEVIGYDTTAGGFFVYDNANYRFVVQNGTGNVGIGTTAPAQKLDVNGTINANTEYRLGNDTYSRVAQLDGGGGWAGGYNFNINSNTAQHDSTGALTGIWFTGGSGLKFYTDTSQVAGTAVTPRMIVDNSGNVGIGTQTPNALLQVGSDIALMSNWPTIGFNMYYNSGWKYLSTNPASLIQENYTNGQFSIQTAASGTAGSAVTLNSNLVINGSNGYVGIATTSPAYLLDVNGTIRGTTIIGAVTGNVAAANVSSGNFGSSTGGGNYSFPASLSLGLNGQLNIPVNNAAVDVINLSKGADSDRDWITWHQGSGVADWRVGMTQASQSGYSLSFYNANGVTATSGNPGTEIMRLGAYGLTNPIAAFPGNTYVGIGTTAPANTLDVKSDTGISISGSNFSNAYSLNRDFNTGYLWITGRQNSFSGYRFFVNTSTEALTILNSGNVGIGIASPTSLLHILTPSISTSTTILTLDANGVSATDEDLRIKFQDSASYPMAYIGSGFQAGTTNGTYLGFSTVAANPNGVPTERMHIDNNGNVGIGTRTPNYTLDVVGGFTHLGVNSQAIPPSDTANGGLIVGWNRSAGSAEVNFYSAYNSATNQGGFMFSRKTGASTYEDLMYLEGDKRLGIGTTTPGYALTVSGDIDFTGNLYQNGTLFSGGGWTRDSLNGYIYPTASTDNVAIGGTNPGTWKLGVSGNAAFGVGGGTAAKSIWQEWSNYTLEVGYADAKGGAYLQGTTNGAVGNLILNGSGGNVSVGGTSTAAKFDVITTSETNPQGIGAFDGRHAAFGPGIADGVAISKTSGGSGYITSVRPNVAWDPLGFQASNYNWFLGGSTTASVMITTGGNLGIGTTTPQALLSVGNNTTSTVAIFGGGTGKISVGTVDPLYTINGENFATYVPGMTGQKEETTGVVTLPAGSSEKTIDFANAEKGSDLWLFAQVTDLKDNFDHLTVLLTPSFDGKTWYTKDAKNLKLIIHGAQSSGSGGSDMEISYRLSAPRFDSATWSNFAPSNEGQGLIINY